MKIYNVAKVAISELFQSAIEYFNKKYQQSEGQFSLASAWGQLLNAQHELSRLNLYYIEDAITELNPNTALRPDSIYGLSTLTGHRPFVGNASSGVLTLFRKNKSINIPNSNIIIPNRSKLYNRINGLEYTIVLDSDYIIIPNDITTSIDLKIIQGIFEKQVVTGTGEQLQTFNFSNGGNYLFDHDDIDVYVNSTKWERVNSLLEMSYNSETYYLSAGITGGITIFFGNELSGKIPPLGANIIIEYIKHNGEDGNITTNNNVFEFEDDIFDVTGEEVEINKHFGLTITKDVSFGANSENIELTRRMFNRIDRSNVLYTPTSFKLFLQKFNLFSVIHVFKTTDDNILQDDKIVYMILIPDIKKRIGKSINYFNIPIEYFKITNTEKERIIEMIQKSGRKPSDLEISIIDPTIRKYVMNVNIIAFPEFSVQKELLKENIRAVVSDYFTYNERFDRIPKSDLIRVIEGVKGVDSVSVTFIGEQNEINKKQNPTSTELVGLDGFNDIILKDREIAVLRGGWVDSNGIYYSDNIKDQVSMLNISIKN
jgi:hypothetical protein